MTAAANERSDRSPARAAAAGGKKRRKSAAVGAAVTLAEAGFLRHELRQRGLHASIRRVKGKANIDRPVHTVRVPPGELETALAIRETVMPDDPSGRAAQADGRRPLSYWRAAAVAGLVGFLAGIRISHGSPLLGIVYAICLGTGAFLAIILFSTPGEPPPPD